MVSVVIYGIIAIALAAAAGYALLVFTNTAQQTTQTQENSVRMEQAVTALRASLRAIDANGVLYIPAGVSYTAPSGATYNVLPQSLGVVGTAPWGTPYAYCPIAISASAHTQTTGDPTSITSYDGSTYAITSYHDATTGQVPYVVAGSITVPAGSGYVGFVLSNLSVSGAVPSCDKITFDANNNPRVQGGMVRAVTAGTAFNQRAVASMDRLEIYVVPDTGTPTGDLTGIDKNNTTTFSNAILMWETLQPRLTEIYLTTPGTYVISDAMNAEIKRIYAAAEAPALIITTADNTSSGYNMQLSTALNLKTPVTFENLASLDFMNKIVTSYAPLTFRNVSVASTGGSQNLFIVNGDLKLIDSGFSGVGINAYQSKVSLYNIATPAPATTSTVTNSFTNSPFKLYNSQLYFESNPTLSAIPSAVYGISDTSGNNLAIYAENSSVYTHVTDNLILNNSINLVNSKWSQDGGLAGTTAALQAGSSMYLANTASIVLQPTTAVASVLNVTGGSVVSNYAPFTISLPTAGSVSTTCVLLDNSKFAQYQSGSATSPAGLAVNCNVNPIALYNGSTLSQFATTYSATDAKIAISGPAAASSIVAYSGSLVSINNALMTLSAAGAGSFNLYLNNSQLALNSTNSAYPSAISITNTGTWTAGVTSEGGRVSFNWSNLTANKPYTYGAIYLTRASQLDLYQATINQAAVAGSNCVFLDNPNWGGGYTGLPAYGSSGATLGNATNTLYYPNSSPGTSSSPNTVDSGVSGFNTPTVSLAPTGGPYTSVDITSLDEAVQNIINAENIGMTGNIRLALLTCK